MRARLTSTRLTDKRRINAATQTAAKMEPFYWEIGDWFGPLVTGGVHESMAIASASKWIYSSYWIQRIGGIANLSPVDLPYFNFTSGYVNFSFCGRSETVGACATKRSNDVIDQSKVGVFDYGGGHMQMHAASNGLGGLDEVELAAEIDDKLGILLSYNSPQLAGGAEMEPSQYGQMLQDLLTSPSRNNWLGAHAIPAGPPAPPGEDWMYSIGHWVEPDGTFSSPGAFGFYPWIDKDKQYYGIVARHKLGAAHESIFDGRKIRKAWLTGVVQ